MPYMPYKTVLVCLDNRSRAKDTLETAVGLAKSFGAQLMGVHLEPGISQYVTGGPADMGAGVGYSMDARRAGEEAERIRVRSAEAEQMFKDALGAASVKNAGWRTVDGDLLAGASQLGRYADLTVIGQADADDHAASYPVALPGAMALSTGRPVLVVPYAGEYRVVGKHMAIAWNGSREAARAVFDAIPFLHAAERITIITVAPGHEVVGDSPSKELQDYLQRRGLDSRVERLVPGGLTTTDAILSALADIGADLLVMGAYGHSRVRELFLGGVSRGILTQMTVPVLFSH